MLWGKTAALSGKIVAIVYVYLLCIQPGVDKGKQGILMVSIQLGQQCLDGHGGHFLTAS